MGIYVSVHAYVLHTYAMGVHVYVNTGWYMSPDDFHMLALVVCACVHVKLLVYGTVESVCMYVYMRVRAFPYDNTYVLFYSRKK